MWALESVDEMKGQISATEYVYKFSSLHLIIAMHFFICISIAIHLIYMLDCHWINMNAPAGKGDPKMWYEIFFAIQY